MIPDSKNPYPTAESYVLDILSTRPRLSVKDLYALFLQKDTRKITIQAFYALIRKMIDQRILVKEGQALLIDASWAAALLAFADKVKGVYLTNESAASNIVLQPGERREIVFETVMAMDNFWTNALIVALYRLQQDDSSENRDVCAYNYHSWFQIARTAQEQSLADAYEQTGLHYYVASGTHSFLDQAVAETIGTKHFRYTMIEPTEFFRPNYYVTVVGDVIFEMSLPLYIDQLMEKIYAGVNNVAEFDRQEVLRIIQLPARTTLVITNDKKRANDICQKLKAYFEKNTSGSTPRRLSRRVI